MSISFVSFVTPFPSLQKDYYYSSTLLQSVLLSFPLPAYYSQCITVQVKKTFSDVGQERVALEKCMGFTNLMDFSTFHVLFNQRESLRAELILTMLQNYLLLSFTIFQGYLLCQATEM